jgi:hypothetical protein
MRISNVSKSVYCVKTEKRVERGREEERVIIFYFFFLSTASYLKYLSPRLSHEVNKGEIKDNNGITVLLIGG